VLSGSLAATPLRAQGFPPEQALRRMRVPDGFRVKLVASEPVIRQPLTMTFDGRGRLWVVQYLQYPTPAGLTPVRVDQYLRTTYDRVPEPPPRGPQGADRITILEDPDEHGRYRKAHDFLTGLNLASGLALGYGGVFVLQPPYLLFYPDRDHDDVPDGPPEVLLTGFGMEDAHAVANSLTWGPDGWLYGAQGSTVTAHVRGLEFQQGIWRYHPRTRRFELFAEGGGNTWGLDFDAHGQLLAGTNFGGSALFHQVQGAYYVKGFSKHGPLHNPHAFGYFDHVPCQGFRGGHVTIGGIVYQGGAYPEPFHGRYLAGNLLSNALHAYDLEPHGSSFRSRFAGEFLAAHDTWFRPVDCLTGPDGSVYVADWYDARANHVDPVDTWDRSNGRIYKIEARGTRPVGKLDLDHLSSQELVALLGDPNAWYAGEARRRLAERRDSAVIPGLRRAVLDSKGRLALESLWALYVSGGFDEALAGRLLVHPNEHVRAWTVRFLGDDNKVSPVLRDRLITLARTEPSPLVRSQLACSCKRLPAADCLAIVGPLLGRQEDVNDPHIPLLLWWAVEDKARGHRDQVLDLLDRTGWQTPLVRRFLLERLARRYAAEGTEADLNFCARLLARAPGPVEQRLLLRGLDRALEGRQPTAVPAALEKEVQRLWGRQPADPTLLRLAVRLGSAEAYRRALDRAADARAPEADRLALVELLGQVGKADAVPVLLRVLSGARTEDLRGAALAALEPFPDRTVAEQVLALYPGLSGPLKARAQSLLASRAGSALLLAEAVEAGRVATREVSLDQVRRLARYHDARLEQLVEKHWGRVGPAPAGEKVARIRSVAAILGQGRGDPHRGRLLFQKNCASCHTLFGEGNPVGPDLTSADRANRDYLLTQVIDPSAVIRPEYVAYTVETRDGRSLTGLVAESTPTTITLVDGKSGRTVLPRARIEQMTPSPVSLMPEKLLDGLTDQELRDLFSYLQGGPPRAKEDRSGRMDRAVAPIPSTLYPISARSRVWP
jgi:putative membrane-bound dehydrogenase-like protein